MILRLKMCGSQEEPVENYTSDAQEITEEDLTGGDENGNGNGNDNIEEKKNHDTNTDEIIDEITGQMKLF